MNDTPRDVAERYRQMLMKRSGTDRLKMGFEMFDAARALIWASLKNEREHTKKVQLLLRCYGRDLDAKTLSAVLKQLK